MEPHAKKLEQAQILAKRAATQVGALELAWLCLGLQCHCFLGCNTGWSGRRWAVYTVISTQSWGCSSLDLGRKEVGWLSCHPSRLSGDGSTLAGRGHDGDWCGVFQIDGLEEKLAHCRQSMEEVDVKLRREKLSPEGRYWCPPPFTAVAVHFN